MHPQLPGLINTSLNHGNQESILNRVFTLRNQYYRGETIAYCNLPHRLPKCVLMNPILLLTCTCLGGLHGKFFIHYHKTYREVNIKRHSAELIVLNVPGQMDHHHCTSVKINDAAFVILPIELFTFHRIKIQITIHKHYFNFRLIKCNLTGSTRYRYVY